MRIIHRKPIDAPLFKAGIRTHSSFFAATATIENGSTRRRGKFTTGLINGSLLVAPFWLLVAWLIFHN
ncbi:hypothetical protein [Paenibacillus sacheonensis]|uniref:Uncharacterized protein n=1 Tax=Paenibacillus sacheonensis TaxID=742054 RepID=A0A7X5C3Y0_9BACL|nr:hypothetical protein [Paenibacillus sacheonensis]MBM7569040.1 hypothetical protein [Paenibacillus sacheonensis]NBC72780.1 hypothetical protein [Paenibacillus sacheonensis]